MDDLIRRQESIEYFVTNVGWHDEDGYPVEDSDELRKIWTDLFNGLPSAQKKGKWLDKKVIPVYENGFSLQSCRCSECDRYDTRPYMYNFSEPNFCSYCGSEMKGGEE